MISTVTEIDIELMKSDVVLSMKKSGTNTGRIKMFCFLIRIGAINSASELNEFIQQNFEVFALSPWIYFTDIILEEWDKYLLESGEEEGIETIIDERYGIPTIEERQQLMLWYEKV